MVELDLLIIGAGPAGLTAAQYGARANLKVLVIEMVSVGGQALTIDVLENYPGNLGREDSTKNEIGLPKSGYEFALDLQKQAENFGASFLFDKVNSIQKKGIIFEVVTGDGSLFNAKALIIATGSKPRLLGIPGEEKFSGRGVSYCATCDGNFFKDKKIFVVGGGDAACDEARYLSKLTKTVILVHRREGFRAQKALVKRTFENPNIEVRLNTVIKEIKGDKKVNSVILSNTINGESIEENADAVFIFAGTVPQSLIINDLNPDIDDEGYIKTDHKMQTNIPGLYAAGDIRAGAFRQVVTAAADGATAAHNAAKYIDEIY